MVQSSRLNRASLLLIPISVLGVAAVAIFSLFRLININQTKLFDMYIAQRSNLVFEYNQKKNSLSTGSQIDTTSISSVNNGIQSSIDNVDILIDLQKKILKINADVKRFGLSQSQISELEINTTQDQGEYDYLNTLKIKLNRKIQLIQLYKNVNEANACIKDNPKKEECINYSNNLDLLIELNKELYLEYKDQITKLANTYKQLNNSDKTKRINQIIVTHNKIINEIEESFNTL